MIGLSFVGLALFAYFQRHELPAEYETDKLLPYFMSLAFPAGAVGLVIAAIAAASMSSLNSALNSCSSVAVVTSKPAVRIATARGQRNPKDEQRHSARRNGSPVLRDYRTIAAGNVSRLGSLLRSPTAGERVYRAAVRDLPARDVCPQCP